MAGRRSTEADVVLGVRLYAARREAGVTQAACGAAIGVSAAQWQKYEKGTNRISATSLAPIAALTGKPVAWFFGEEPDLSPDETAELETAVLGAVDRIVGRRRAAQAEARA